MLKPLALTALIAVAMLSLPDVLAAQSRSAVTAAELETAVTTPRLNTREALLTLVRSDAAQREAERLGVSGTELVRQAAALDQAAIDRIDAETGFTGRSLVGGADKIVISTTTLIIALLILILITD